MKHRNEVLTQAIRKIGRTTTPEELKARGIRRVQSLRFADLQSMVEKAVHETVMERIEGTQPSTSPLVEQALGRVDDLVQLHDVLTRSRSTLRNESQAPPPASSDSRLPALPVSESAQIVTLQRRVNKLVDLLSSVETELGRALQLLSSRRSGFRESQRVKKEDDCGSERVDMMNALFVQNKKLHQKGTG